MKRFRRIHVFTRHPARTRRAAAKPRPLAVRAAVLGGLGLVWVGLGGGCEYETIRVTPKSGNILTKLADQGKLRVDGPGGDPRAERRGATYAVGLDTFRGPDRFRKAHERMRALKEQAGLADLWTVDRDATLELYLGRFRGPTDPLAKAALDRVRAAEVDGRRIYKDAALAALGAGAARARQQDFDELNLRRFSNRGKLTLQVAVYDEAYGADFRNAAEEAAAALREDGDRAFYYHGPHRSMVTVGLFTFDDDFIQEGKQRAYGPGIEELREKYPYNLVNGITVIQRHKDGETIGEQQSLIVRVP